MALLDILHYPDPRLRNRAEPIDTVTDAHRRLAEDMLETMYHAPGIGLAATQVNVHQRMLVADVSEHRDDPRVFINPVIVSSDGEEEMEEGCLSVPGVFDTVRRADRITVEHLDLNGNACRLEADGLLAVCIQHEIDHLDGKLFVDYLSQLKRSRIKQKLKKQQKHAS